MIDWSNPNEKISDHFTVRESIWLPSWNRMATPEDGLNDEVNENLIYLFHAMDKIREFIAKPIRVHVAYRPVEYNREIGGARASAHIIGKAVDWDCGEFCDETRMRLISMLKVWDVRMENRQGSNWVHIDTMPVVDGGNRYFYP